MTDLTPTERTAADEIRDAGFHGMDSHWLAVLDAIPPWVFVELAIERGALRTTTSELAPGVGSTVYVRTALGRGPQHGPRFSDDPPGTL